MARIRPPAVAGTFYPADAHVLRSLVGRFLSDAAEPFARLTPRMLIVPHAGLVYSGPVAASAYRWVQAAPPAAWVLLGPSHYLRFDGLALPAASALSTPLGEIAVDDGLRSRVVEHAQSSQAAHRREHSLEVQLPFVQLIAPDSTCLPVLTGDDEPAAGARLLDELADDPDVVAVISSDLSHYHDYDTARALDRTTAAAIVELRSGDIGAGAACGRTAVRAGLAVAARRGWRCEQVDLRTSGDTQGDRSRVVGYGAFVLGPAD